MSELKQHMQQLVANFEPVEGDFKVKDLSFLPKTYVEAELVTSMLKEEMSYEEACIAYVEKKYYYESNGLPLPIEDNG
jgi:pyruvate-formate lyase